MYSLLRPLRPAVFARARIQLQCHQPAYLRFQSSVSSCPSCHKPFPTHIPACTSCWSIHPLPPNISHHDLLDVPYDPNPFAVNLSTLKNHFRKAQAFCHPDAWASKSPKELDLAHTLSSKLNEAYQCLSNPLARAEYILKRNGVSISESDHLQDMTLLANVMEAREVIDACTPDDISEIHQLKDANEEDTKEVIAEVDSLISEQKWQEAKAAAIKLRYLQGIERAIKRWLDQNT
ncbi:hypothetical protein CVT25_001926 [Psilocybe cyanescens]|uniref:J domain-containing protein n=1 Tax=Psilocybe cyanescens TaxID=93625 RepID=A0A409WQP3_PSICY|nr:hypothetical protein CVT25_001926 [Psilocybe cyanescens]